MLIYISSAITGSGRSAGSMQRPRQLGHGEDEDDDAGADHKRSQALIRIHEKAETCRGTLTHPGSFKSRQKMSSRFSGTMEG